MEQQVGRILMGAGSKSQSELLNAADERYRALACQQRWIRQTSFSSVSHLSRSRVETHVLLVG